MKSRRFKKRELREAAALLRGAMLSACPAPGDCEYAFSEQFEERMDRLMGRRPKKNRAKRVLQRAAVLFLAAVLSAGLYLAVDTQARAAFFGWVREVYERLIVYRFEDSAAGDALPVYTLTWVPEGFVLERTVQFRTGCDLLYQDESEGRSFVFSYRRMSDGLEAYYLAEGNEYELERVAVNGIEGDFYQTTEMEGTNNLIWMDEERQIVFMLDSNLEKDVMLHIADSTILE